MKLQFEPELFAVLDVHIHSDGAGNAGGSILRSRLTPEEQQRWLTKIMEADTKHLPHEPLFNSDTQE